MAAGTGAGTLDPVTVFALVGALGVGAQWLAWRVQMPAIVLMLAAGLLVGPGLGLFDPARDIGPLMGPMVAIAVAVILFEGGLSLNLHSLRDAAQGVWRLVLVGAPLGWLGSTLALHYAAGLGWAVAAVFGGIMIVTGPTVIAPLLRQARLSRRPAQLLQWEAIVNDPVGALAAVLAFEVVLVMAATETATGAALSMVWGIAVALALGGGAGWGLARAFRGGHVPEYMKVPMLFATLLGVFALSDTVLHESGLLTVTVMGLWMANVDLPSYAELRRFKEHATVLLVSGVFILLAASMDMERLMLLDWRAGLFVAVTILLVRPLTVLISLLGTAVPLRERLLVAFTGPRGVVLVAVAGLFGERLVALGYEDAARLAPLAFALVAATVVLHGFALGPMGRALGLAQKGPPGVILVGGSAFSVALGAALERLDVPVLVSDPSHARLRAARKAGLGTFFGDILSEAAEHSVELVSFGQVVALTGNDAYNTLVATDLAPEFGRDNVYQLRRAREDGARHALPATLGGRRILGALDHWALEQRMAQGWRVRTTRLSADYTIEDWRADNPDAVPLVETGESGAPRFIVGEDAAQGGEGVRITALAPPRETGEDA